MTVVVELVVPELGAVVLLGGTDVDVLTDPDVDRLVEEDDTGTHGLAQKSIGTVMLESGSMMPHPVVVVRTP